MLVKFSGYLFALMFLSACASSVGAPRTSINPNRDFATIIINNTLDATELANLVRAGSIGEQKRNEIVQARMAEIDVLYFEYENKVSNEIRQGNFAVTFAEIVVGGVGSLSSGGVSQNLSALSSAISGTKAAFDKDLLLDQSIQAFVSQMRANRAAVKTLIVERLRSGPAEYTLQLALSDLAEYQQAGTLASALAGITQSAQIEENKATDALRSEEHKSIFRSNPVNASARAIRLRDWIRSGTSPQEKADRSRMATLCYDKVGKPQGYVDIGFEPFLKTSNSYPKLEVRVVDCLEVEQGVTF
jgi:hypothetical protein